MSKFFFKTLLFLKDCSTYICCFLLFCILLLTAMEDDLWRLSHRDYWERFQRSGTMNNTCCREDKVVRTTWQTLDVLCGTFCYMFWCVMFMYNLVLVSSFSPEDWNVIYCVWSCILFSSEKPDTAICPYLSKESHSDKPYNNHKVVL